jgi:hypothetical protein
LFRSVDNPNNNAIHSPFGSNQPQTNPTMPIISPVITAPPTSIPPVAPKVANYDAESAGASTASSSTISSEQTGAQNVAAAPQPNIQPITAGAPYSLPPQPPMPLAGPPGNVKNLPPINFRYSFLNHVDGDSGLFGNFRKEPEELMRTIEATARATDIR